MKIYYTILNENDDNKLKSLFFKDKEDDIFVTWSNISTNMASLKLSAKGIKEYLRNPIRFISEANYIYITVDSNGNLNKPIFKIIETNETKASGNEFIKYKLNTNHVGQIYIPFADSTHDDYAIRLNVDKESVENLLDLIPDAIEVKANQEDFKKIYSENSPSLKIIGTSNNGEWTKIKIQLTINGNNLAKEDVRIFAKSSSGYIANREIYTNTLGSAEFKVLPYGLEKDEVMNVEFGFKYFSNIVSQNIIA
jgi:hypothetical protein